ncbi:NHLM bacteriocin system ABC transporter, ATP-binding protein [Selenomonas ruminantium]|uniref:NHLM bacteriocin system ABC transporter, ATP-binding protein n=1 Tax=Selenomonas ruminantium TaxID=971 RepID=A0A1M6UDK5_SELRU|nr:NHLP bacteriocin export ABC transporter permease/ATPase subunit [Selenomonas ruminantium]SHK67256.1 NHLM bacteriocin system ABC transporter, ATP-binding protein [Selenomonas ruminantium]
MHLPEHAETKLYGGDRFLLAADDMAYEVVTGRVEAYAVTKGEKSFRQCYLLTLAPGQAAFPALDDFEQIEVQLYAVEDSVIRPLSLQADWDEKLRPLMKLWFRNLAKLPWLRQLAEQGDDTIGSWQRGTVMNSCAGPELLSAFGQNESIFAMLLGVRFGSEDKRLARRTKIREHSKQLLLENGVRSLLGEEKLYAARLPGQKSEDRMDYVFVAKQAAKALGMFAEDMELNAETMESLDDIALWRRLLQKANMQMRQVKLTTGWQAKDTGTILGFWGKERIPAAFVPQTPESYKVITGQDPQGILLTADNIGQVQTEAFQCYAGFPARALKLWDLIRFMFRQCWRSDYQAILLCSLFAGLIPLVTPIITETVFEDIIPILDRQGLATVTQALMVTSFTTAALSVVRSIAVMRISNRIEMSAEAAMWGRLLSMPAGFFRRFTAGELASRMGGIGIAKNLASGEFVEGILSFLFSFWSIFLMSYYSWELTSTAVAIWLIYGLFIAFVYRRVLFFQRKIIAAGNKNAGTVQQIFAGLAKFRVQGAEEQAYSLWARDFGESWNWNLRLRWQNNYTSIIGSVQPFILTMVLYCVAVYGMEILGPNGQVETGLSYAQFIAFNAAYSSFNAVMGGCIKLVGQYFGIQPQLENLRPILQAEPENTGDKQEAGRITGQLEVSHLSFAYPDPQTGEWGTEVLRDVNFSIAAGENVAIVGKSGSGKSTLVRLLLGFEQPKSGGIYFDGQDLAGLNLPSVRSQMGVVLQNGQLMTGDIYTNIVGTRLLPQQAAWEAAAAAGIDEDIAAMPMGMQTVISEGSSNISGGQRQRILIARALVAKPSLVIFDEATSALDNRSQAIVTESLEKLKATRIVVAHRLSTIRGCDRIIVIDEGRVAEQGTFDELLARQGIFADLVKRQVA